MFRQYQIVYNTDLYQALPTNNITTCEPCAAYNISCEMKAVTFRIGCLAHSFKFTKLKYSITLKANKYIDETNSD